MSNFPKKVETSLAAFGQEHVLRFWDALNPSEQSTLVAQIEAIDLAMIARLATGVRGDEDLAKAALRAEPPRAIRLSDQSDCDHARRRGEAALSAGEVGVVLVAGGQGTRLGFDHPKGMYPIGPISGATLFQIHFERVRAVAARYGVSIPLYLMTSPATHEETVAFLDENGCFGLPKDDLRIFRQGTMPAVDVSSGKLLLESPSAVCLSPDGHGGMVDAMRTSGAADDAMRRGLKHLFYFQVDNPLAPICDPTFIGRHILCESEMSSLAIKKQTPTERVGNFVSINGKTRIIEYIDFPDEIAEIREADGSLRFWAGSVAIHVFDVAFLQRVQSNPDALPFHVARKPIPYIDANGVLVQPDKPNALKFERFIFDLLPVARNAIVVEAPEEEIFAPLKNAPGAARDTPSFVQMRMFEQSARWIRSTGANVADGTRIEISPLYALDARDIAKHFERGIVFDGVQYMTGN